MEIYNEDNKKKKLLNEIDRNKELLKKEYEYLKNEDDEINNILLEKYKYYYDENDNNNKLIITNLNNLINYLDNEENESKQRDIKQLYKLINKLL